MAYNLKYNHNTNLGVRSILSPFNQYLKKDEKRRNSISPFQGRNNFGGPEIVEDSNTYHADAVHFDEVFGSNTLSSWLQNDNLIATNGTDFSYSLWIKASPIVDHLSQIIFVIDPDGNYTSNFGFNTSFASPIASGFLAAFFNSGGGSALIAKSSNAIADGFWHHILVSGDTLNGVVKIFVDDVDVTVVGQNDTPFTMVFNGLSSWIMADDSFDSEGSCDLADLWIAPNVSLLSGGTIPEATRRKFISATGKPVDLGADGANPTGSAPAIFFSGDASTFATNLGQGGAYTHHGATVTNASTSPSD